MLWLHIICCEEIKLVYLYVKETIVIRIASSLNLHTYTKQAFLNQLEG